MNKRASEFEVQALAYWNLKQAYPIVRGEYKIPGARFDIAVFDEDENLMFIVEVKKSSKTHSTRQGERYTQLTGVPTIYIRGMDEAENAINFVKENLKDCHVRTV